MEMLSKQAVDDLNKAKRLIQSILKNKEEIEHIFSEAPLNTDNIFNRNYIELPEEKISLLKQIIGEELSIAFLYYNHSGAPTLEAKVYCAEIIKFSRAILDGQFSLQVKIALMNHLNILGYLFDRGDENYYVCEHILREFICELEKFYLAQSAEDQKVIDTVLLWGHEDSIDNFKRHLDNVNEKLKNKDTGKIRFARDTDIEKWLERQGS